MYNLAICLDFVFLVFSVDLFMIGLVLQLQFSIERSGDCHSNPAILPFVTIKHDYSDTIL